MTGVQTCALPIYPYEFISNVSEEYHIKVTGENDSFGCLFFVVQGYNLFYNCNNYNNKLVIYMEELENLEEYSIGE